jgi:hypothetical protein
MKENKKTIEANEFKFTRSNQQSKSRWLYLEMVASILNEQGQIYNPPGTKLEVKFTKENLYEIYWNSTRKWMFPGKEKQLNTKEFSELVEMILMMFAKVFDIHIDFPDYKRITDEL